MKRWYVVQVYAGYEEAAKTDIIKRVKEAGLEDYVGQVLVPEARQKYFFEFDETKNQQLFPGYVLIEMEMVPQALRTVVSSSKVTRFLGGLDPVPLNQKEVDRIISQVKGEIAVHTQREEFSIGSEIDIKEGPFAGFVGVVDKVDHDNEKLSVMVSIFGRMTPVELSFHQVKR